MGQAGYLSHGSYADGIFAPAKIRRGLGAAAPKKGSFLKKECALWGAGGMGGNAPHGADGVGNSWRAVDKRFHRLSTGCLSYPHRERATKCDRSVSSEADGASRPFPISSVTRLDLA